MRAESLQGDRSTVVRTFCNGAAREKGCADLRRGSAFNGVTQRRLIVTDQGSVRLNGVRIRREQFAKLAQQGSWDVLTSGTLTHEELTTALHRIQINRLEIINSGFAL